MIVWIILFLLILAISFVLALHSLRDFPQIHPDSKSFGLYLIRNTKNLTVEFLDFLHNILLKTSTLVSFERLIKGRHSALSFFAPKSIAERCGALDLLELEDYSAGVSEDKIAIWDVEVENPKPPPKFGESLFKNFPQLLQDEQFFWQVILKPKKESFACQIRAAVITGDAKRRTDLTTNVMVFFGDLIKVPQPFSTIQLLNFYQNRAISPHKNNPTLNSLEVLRLVKLGF